MTVIEYLKQGKIRYDDYNTQIWIDTPKKGSILLIDVRGWGHIQNVFKPIDKSGEIDFSKASKLQDDIANFIIEAIEEKLAKNN